MKYIVASLIISLPSLALAWNDRGHSLVAELAYQELPLEVRAAVIDVLKNHPHWDEYLTADRPDNVPEDRWVFWRAATWSDWVKSHSHPQDHRQYHFINIPFVPPSSEFEPAEAEPGIPNVVTQLPIEMDQVQASSPINRAIAVCWVFHLIGDIHQPLHCATLFSEQFPDGDRGGNRALVRVTNSPVKLHAFWDGLLGKSVSLPALGNAAADVKQAEQAAQEKINHELAENTNVAAWAQEGYRAAVEIAYLNGELEVINSDDHHGHGQQVPKAPEDYAQNSGTYARLAVAKAGHRLANTVKQLFQ